MARDDVSLRAGNDSGRHGSRRNAALCRNARARLYACRGIPLSPSRPRRHALRQSCRDGDANCASRRGYRHRPHAAAELLRARFLRRRRTACRSAPVHLLDRPVCQADGRDRNGRPRIARGQCRHRPAQPASRDARRTGGHRAAGRRRADSYPRRRTDQGSRGMHRLVGPAAGRVAARTCARRPALVPDPCDPHHRDGDLSACQERRRRRPLPDYRSKPRRRHFSDP